MQVISDIEATPGGTVRLEVGPGGFTVTPVGPGESEWDEDTIAWLAILGGFTGGWIMFGLSKLFETAGSERLATGFLWAIAPFAVLMLAGMLVMAVSELLGCAVALVLLLLLPVWVLPPVRRWLRHTKQVPTGPPVHVAAASVRQAWLDTGNDAARLTVQFGNGSTVVYDTASAKTGQALGEAFGPLLGGRLLRRG